jgi:hypothetical protein
LACNPGGEPGGMQLNAAAGQGFICLPVSAWPEIKNLKKRHFSVIAM